MLLDSASCEFKLLLGNSKVHNVDSDIEVDEASTVELSVDKSIAVLSDIAPVPAQDEAMTIKFIPMVDRYALALNATELFKREDKPKSEGATKDPLNGNNPNSSEVNAVLAVIDGSTDRLAKELAKDVPAKLGKKDK